MARAADCTGADVAVAGTVAVSGGRVAAVVADGLAVDGQLAVLRIDLQRAGRVVHYDLPWTPMRLDQRESNMCSIAT